MRIGIGYDVHAFAEGRPLILGGVRIPYESGLIGHSDADVLAHAIADALLGAARLGDIGEHFPDTDKRYAGADSLELLSHVAELLQESGLRIVDVDAVLILERPKVSPHRDEMRRNLASSMRIPIECVGLKATTSEGLGYEGRGEGVSAQAVALLSEV